MTFWKWSKTAASNSNADSTINWAEGQSPASVNDSARAVMAAAAKFRDDVSGGSITTTGSSNAYAVTTNQGLTSLTDGFYIGFIANFTNTGTSTIDVDGLGAKPLRIAGSVETPAGVIVANAVYHAVYKLSSDQWILWNYPIAATIPSGTKMLFRQTSAPTGWTKETTNDNAAIRIVSGTASTGGTAGFTTALASRTIALGNLPSTNLSLASLTATLSNVALNARSIADPGGGTVTAIVDQSNATAGTTTTAFSSATITMGGSIPLGGSGTAMDFAVKYVDVISATKD